MKINPSARTHGIEGDDILYAAEWALWIEDLDEDTPSRQLRIGFDTKGRLLELAVLVFDSGNELVIHAMKARPGAIDLLP
ncbi:toxin [Actinomyces sp. B33]|uniref:toxin n=1 Tax=Actinomyces sp. B33 TaxID=2942131 RepID=UPI00233FBF82|nr:toxin [Actinomyces sp. B33]MDC4232324.1 toxin [Actinomyces sp. B33]